MKTSDVIKYFGGTQVAVAKALGITKASVNSWGAYPPPGRQYQIEVLSKGELKAHRAGLAA